MTGITGKVGGIVARTLLAARLPVRAVVRDADKGRAWAEKGCEVAVASIADAEGLKKAFSGVDGVFLMTPPDFDPEPGFPKTHEAIAAVKAAIVAAQPAKVVFLSTVGAQVRNSALLNNSKITEEGLRTVSVPVAFLRAAWFMENASWDVEAAKVGVVPSFLQPLDHPIPMVATADIGIELQPTCSVKTGGDYASSSSKGRVAIRRTTSPWGLLQAFGHPVRMEPMPRDTWEPLFRSQGIKHPLPRIRMIDGFNEGWIDFEWTGAEHRTGRITLEAVLKDLSGQVDFGPNSRMPALSHSF